MFEYQRVWPLTKRKLKVFLFKNKTRSRVQIRKFFQILAKKIINKAFNKF